MSHSELAIAGLYDHEHEAVREKQRRIPDWGGDDVFATTPRRRRFEHAEDRAPHLRLRDTSGHPMPRLVEPAPAVAELPAEAPLAAAEPEPAPADPYMEPPAIAANGRRVVTITGRPGETRAPRALDATRRPARTWEERLVHQPERIAGWAFALGLLLIVIAILSA